MQVNFVSFSVLSCALKIQISQDAAWSVPDTGMLPPPADPRWPPRACSRAGMLTGSTSFAPLCG